MVSTFGYYTVEKLTALDSIITDIRDILKMNPEEETPQRTKLLELYKKKTEIESELSILNKSLEAMKEAGTH